MAVKNHEMDSLLRDAAMKEFLEYGYNDASLRRIADSAGTTTGSLYMRYKNKDSLFCSLTECITEAAETAFEDLMPIYLSASSTEDMLEASIRESEKIIDILFENYDAAILLLCKSDGSSVTGFFEELIERKIQSSERVLSGLVQEDELTHVFEMLLTVQFDMYRQIIRKQYSREESRRCMKIMMEFMNSGWQSLMPKLITRKGASGR